MSGTPTQDAWMLEGGGEMGALIGQFDWARHAARPTVTWSHSLRATVAMLLHSRHPMFLWWGPELIQIYNDAYMPSFGVGKHPTSLGQRGRDCWPEIWHIIGPQIDDVMRRGDRELASGRPGSDLSERRDRRGVLDLRILAGLRR